MPSKFRQIAWLAIAVVSLVVSERRAAAQQHDHAHMNMAASQGWQFMYDGVVWAVFNDQSGPRGGTEFVAPNWWMLMASRKTSHGTVTPKASFASAAASTPTRYRPRSFKLPT